MTDGQYVYLWQIKEGIRGRPGADLVELLSDAISPDDWITEV